MTMMQSRNRFIIALLLAFACQSKAFVTIAVELDPYFTSTPPACSSTFVSNFESNLTAWVLNATKTISFLSDLKVPGGFHLSYQNPVTRRLHSFRRIKTTTTLTPTSCSKCTSAGCTLSCALGVCDLCAGSRRVLGDVTSEHTNDEGRVRDERALTTADWTSVGTYVSNAVEPQIISYATAYSHGCLGDFNLLKVGVTFLSNVPIDATMEGALVAAFGAPAPAPPPNTAKSCCSIDFLNCIPYCGTTQQQCQTCSAVDVDWLPWGAPAQGSCISRWNGCAWNPTGCCRGLQCVGDQFWKGCVYVPHLTSPPTSPPTRAPTLRPTLKPTPFPTTLPTSPPTGRPTSRPTAVPTSPPTLLPTHSPTAQPTLFPTLPPTLQPTPSPTARPTAVPTPSPTTSSPTAQPTAVPTLPPTLPSAPSPTSQPSSE